MSGKAIGGSEGFPSDLAGMTKNQLYDIMSQMKGLIEQNKQQARDILIQNPGLTKALFQAQIMLGMVQPPQVIPSIRPAHPPAPPQQVNPPGLHQVATSQPQSIPRKLAQSQPPGHVPTQHAPPSILHSKGHPNLPSSIPQSSHQISLPPLQAPLQQHQTPSVPNQMKPQLQNPHVQVQSRPTSFPQQYGNQPIPNAGFPQTGGSLHISQPAFHKGGGNLGLDYNPQMERGSSWMGGQSESSSVPHHHITGQVPHHPHQPAPQTSLTPEMEQNLLQQVMSLTAEQINNLPPEQRHQVLQLQLMLRQKKIG